VAWRGLVPAERVTALGIPVVSGGWWGPERSVVHYFVSSGRLLNWIGIGRSSGDSRESWSAQGAVDEALAEFAGWHPRITEMIRATSHLLKMALYDRDPLPAWQQGRVALLGDAAHPMLPYHAQGAAQSIEDAYVLAGCLAAGRADPVAALARYVDLRKPRAEWVQKFSRDAEELFHMTDARAIARRDSQLRDNQARYPRGFPPGQEKLYGYDADAALRRGTDAEVDALSEARESNEAR
jgi:salicylate hydroxylase